MKVLSLRAMLLVLPVMSFAACSTEPKAQPEEPVTAAAAAAAVPAPVLPATIEEAITSEFRTPQNKERDAYRHPLETLKFFGLEPGMRVIEVSPGKGWYSEIIAPLLTAKGEFLPAVQDPGNSEYMQKAVGAYKEWFAAKPTVKATFIPFELGAPLVVTEPVDMVLTFRNVHNWMSQNKAQEAFKSFFVALKPGGILGVVEHRADPKKKQDPKGKSGYVKESEVIRMATAAGFKLDAKSEINANPKDTKDYPDGVWTLPPSLSKGDADRQKYIDIGESDRMTLRFIKPVTLKKPTKATK